MKLKAYLMAIPILCALGILPVAERANAQVEIILRQDGGASQDQTTSGQANQAQIQQSNQGQEASPTQASPAAQPASEVPLPAAAVPGETEYDRYMRLGYAISRQGDYETARNYFQQALAVNPNDRLATIAYWNMVDALQRSQQQPQQQSQPIQQLSQQQPQSEAIPVNAVTTTSTQLDFDSYMNAGYTATEAQDYQTALRYFKLALQIRPNNPYATQAIRNVATYIGQ
ncbi:MAG: hypothetical protein Kow00121_39790 [Elainellaceae cyanobacterium]